MPIKIVHGDLLKQETDAIINTVNCVGVMGKGIALQFKRKWPENFKMYKKACEKKELKTGKMFIYETNSIIRPYYIINFPTKNHWKEKSKLDYIKEGLADLTKCIQNYSIRSISLPPLGCGNGGLEWKEVKAMIFQTFNDLNDVEVFLYEPSPPPSPLLMETRTIKPKMTLGRAAVIKLFSIYRKLDYGLSSIEAQKLAYFIEVAGKDLNLEFCKHQFGPYSKKLPHVLEALEGHYIKGVGDHTARAQIVPLPQGIQEANEFLKNDPNINSILEKVTLLIEGFENPFGLELLATTHWVATKDIVDKNVNEAIKAVYSWSDNSDWNTRKKRLFKEEHITLAWDRLQKQKWIKLQESSA